MKRISISTLTVLAVAVFAVGTAGCGDSGIAGGSDVIGDATSDVMTDASTDTIEQDVAGTDGGRDSVQTDTTVDFILVDGMICRPGDTQCFGSNFLECSDDGMDWISTPCEGGASCTPDGCKQTECEPNRPSCDENGDAVVCLPDGSGYGPPTKCGEGSFCTDGICIQKNCNNGDKQCAGTTILNCVDDEWAGTPCPEGWICFKEQCVECFADEHCQEGMACIDGICTTPPLLVTTLGLPDGQVGAAYAATLEAKGGDGDYTWTIASGDLPGGLDIITDGTIAGTPEAKGDFPFTVKVEDGGGATATADFSITIYDTGLVILSKSPLPSATEGEDYSFQFKASGGTTPYGWMILNGALPAGLNLLSDGALAGMPTNAHGVFDFKVRAVDAGDPIAFAAKEFQLEVKVAPLVIIGDQEINLFLTKAIILPLITVVQGIPIPYNTQLKAKGGIKPYHWAESQLSGLISGFIPNAGIPDGLTLADNGKLSGAVTDTSQVFELKIPFLNYTLKGFFFMAEVKDSQDPQDSDQAIFLIPTVPIDFGGLGL
ncbi:MAG: hypothetical protein GXP54_13620 [Deltaproteobacteria bacterium]|nr:hypothetical protein [Deltaproteobacteria bacterium]